MVELYEQVPQEVNYKAAYRVQRVAERGGVDASMHLIESVATSGEFIALWGEGGLDPSVDAIALRPEYASLFSNELRAARRRLSNHGHQP